MMNDKTICTSQLFGKDILLVALSINDARGLDTKDMRNKLVEYLKKHIKELENESFDLIDIR